ncbi:MAG: xanthine dehydrogenase family protein molybdopterin-binding subunit [Acidobacteria bacterium]|nr:xanthine dehydrogenase family protein molybdopterin-binding subunit [Acidobacteriota bacterium]
MTVTVGTSAPRSDGDAKVSGAAVFGVDFSLPGMVYAQLLRSPVAAGRLMSIATGTAVSMDGVHAVVTAAEVPNERTGIVLFDMPLFATDYITYEGEPLAAVVAETPEIAKAALGAIEFEIEEQEPVATPEQALAPGARLVHPGWATFATMGNLEWPRDGNIVSETVADPGDVDAVFETADLVVEDVYGAPRQYQAYLEPKMALATYEAGRFTIHVSHQFPFNVRDRVAQTLGVPKSAVRVIGHHIGGAFGAKLDLGLEAYAAFLARRTGRPVKMVNTRQEDLLTAPCRENAVVKIRSAVDSAGKILALDVDVVFDSGAYAIDAPYLTSIPMFVFGSVYRVGTARVATRAVYTNTAPTGAFRGVSGTYLVFALERHMDHIANELGVNRRDYRLQALMDDGDEMLNGQILSDASILREAFEVLEERAPWAELGKDPLCGVGMAAAVWLTNPAPGQATVKLNEDGTLGVITAATDNGSGAVTMGVRQIAAEGLGLSADQVVVTMPDTDTAGYDAGSQGSRTTHVVGRAAFEATAEVKNSVLKTAATMLEAAEEDLVVEHGEVHVTGDRSSRVTLAEVAATAMFTEGPIAATGSYTTPIPAFNPTCATGMLLPTWPTPTYHLHIAEVEVDPVTGNVIVLRYLVAQEVGKTINPQGVAGQIQGGVAQGLGYALWERLDIEGGKYVQRSLETYGLPLAVDVPDVEAVLLQHEASAGPYGAKGVAEPPIVPVAGAIANAVADAIGRPIDKIPITPEAVLDALEG